MGCRSTTLGRESTGLVGVKSELAAGGCRNEYYQLKTRTTRGVVRLDRALSKLGVASRAEAKQLIAAGRIRVAGRIVRNAAHLVVPERDEITLDDEKPPARVWRTIAFHKPRGVVTTRRDPEGRPTVFDVLGEHARSLVAVGRLDLASTGLLLLTTDTQLANYLTDPANAIERRYVVTVRGALDDNDVARMTAGIDGLRAHATVVRKRSARETHLIVDLVEGKNREIRRMLESLGHPVTKLMRLAFGPIELGTLQPGQWREVSRAEVREATEGTEFTTKERRKRRRTKNT
jgi:23S rRNA pseudouridine2605 synthase